MERNKNGAFLRNVCLQPLNNKENDQMKSSLTEIIYKFTDF